MENIIEVSHLRKFFGEKMVLKDVNLKVQRGEIIGYIGANGAGKSTTVKLILGLIGDYEGEIRIFGEDIKDSVDYKSKIGYVPESAEIYENLTGREYLTFIGGLYGIDYKRADEKAGKLMELFGIGDVYDARINSYSKGMKQKTLIVSSLLNDPDILFLDEPLGGIDANSVMVFKEVLEKLARLGKTIFYSSHIMEVVEKMSDRIVLIDKGEIVADGKLEDIREESMDGSLEEIFNKLTGFDRHDEIAEEMVDLISGGLEDGRE